MVTSDLTSNFFELFHLPVSYEIDTQDLADRYRSLQSAVHPDKFANSSELERRIAIQQSARINEAFQTLKNPLLRARYLLEINGVDMKSDMDTNMDPAFLMQQMELRERMDGVLSHADSQAEILKIYDVIDESVVELNKQLKKIFARPDSINIEKAKDCVRRYQFLDRIRDETETLEEQLL